jgi:23S rRNA-/tRNA-specific pseudouridylate synthase
MLYHDNHLLVIYKPAGWHSVPNQQVPHTSSHNETLTDSKCLWTFLKERQWGGGSHHDFVLPLHRLDQPCTGVMLWGKTSKAASRIQSQWMHVHKTYLCILDNASDNTTLERLQHHSQVIPSHDTPGWMRLRGCMVRKKQRYRQDHHELTYVSASKGWSVQMIPIPQSNLHVDSLLLQHNTNNDDNMKDEFPKDRYRLCEIEWSVYQHAPRLVLEIVTHQGARHMIRALLSQCGQCPIAGDVRYQATSPLEDASVALHAYRIALPSTLKLGSLTQRTFTAPLPSLWKEWIVET